MLTQQPPSLDIRLTPVSSAEYGATARRPKNSVLDNSKLRATFGAALAEWRQGFRDDSSKISAP